ncbi:MAG: Gfo/Idh/MocA family oxidoreductase [Planctomycetales bacterium]
MPHDAVSLAMVGLGGWGKNVAQSFAQTQRCRMTHICDSSPKSLEQQRRNYPDSIPTSRYEDVLEEQSVEAVALATPAPAHYEMAKRSLLAGKHVYVEKPLTLRTDHAAELVELAERRELKLMVGHLLEYHPAVALMKEQVDSGALGDIYYMYCQRLNLGVVRQHENSFWSLAPHDISIILYLFEEEPVRIVVSGQDILQTGIEDVVFASLQFPSGRIANIHVSWLDPHKMRKMVLVGSEKMLVFDDMEAAEKVRIYDKRACVQNDAVGAIASIGVRHGDIHIPSISNEQPLLIETQHFIDAVLDDTQPRSDGRDGLRVVKILEEVDRQLAQGRPKVLRRAA